MKANGLIRPIGILVLLLILIGSVYLLGFERLGQSYFLWILFLLPVLGFWMFRFFKQYRKSLQAFIENPLLNRMGLVMNASGIYLRAGLLLAALLCLILSLARPQGPPTQSQIASSGIDLLIAFDTSDSTKAVDEYPSRLEAAKSGVSQLFQTFSGDRVGLAIFSGKAFQLSPFSNDYGALDGILSEVDHGMLPNATTDLASVLQLAKEKFSQSKEPSGRALLLFSDGENQQGNWQAAARELNQLGVRIFTVGLGTTQGARIPEQNSIWGIGYKTWQGQDVISRLDQNTLKELAKIGQGQYIHFHQLAQLPGILNQARSQMTSATRVKVGAITYQERFQIWLLLALILLGLERGLRLFPDLLQLPSFGHFKHILARTLKQKKATQMAVFFLLFVILQSAWTWPWDSYLNYQQGQKNYQQKKYDQAAKDFEKGQSPNSNNPQLPYNQGNALFRNQQYDQAVESYRKSLKTPETDPQTKAQSLYNLGNSLYRKGQKSQSSQKEWQEAIKSYQEALKLNPKDTQAIENLNFVQKQLQKQQQAQQQSSKDPKSQQKNQQSQSKQSGQNKQNRDKSQPNPQGSSQANSKKPSTQTQAPQKDAESPLDNLYDDKYIQDLLDQQEQNENKNRKNFQRLPDQKNQDPIDDPMSLFDQQDRDPNLKDW